MVELNDRARPRIGRGIWLRLALGGLIVLAGVWFTRAAVWPCGALDRSSGCVSSAPLDLAAVGLDPASARVNYLAFDLAPGGKAAMVGITDETAAGRRSVLALYDAATGGVLQVLREEVRGDSGHAAFGQAALSPDGTRAAAVFMRSRDMDALDDATAFDELVVYDVGDGSVIETLIRREGDESGVVDCVSMLDFTADGTQLQCGFSLIDIATGEKTSLLSDDRFVFPIPADFMPDGRAPDGTRATREDLGSQLSLFDGYGGFHFAPDSVGVVEVLVAYHENRGQRWWTPSVFRRMSAVGVWDGQTKELQRSLMSNRRYAETAWSRDSGHFGFVTDDLRLEVFQR